MRLCLSGHSPTPRNCPLQYFQRRLNTAIIMAMSADTPLFEGFVDTTMDALRLIEVRVTALSEVVSGMLTIHPLIPSLSVSSIHLDAPGSA